MSQLLDAIDTETGEIERRQLEVKDSIKKLEAEASELEKRHEYLLDVRTTYTEFALSQSADPPPVERPSSVQKSDKTPKPKKPVAPKDRSALERQIVAIVKERGSVSAADVRSSVSSGDAVVKAALQRLVNNGALDRTGATRSTRYSIASKQVAALSATPAATKAAPPITGGVQQPNLEGQIFGLICHRRMSPTEVATELDAEVSDVIVELRKLRDDGDAECSNGLWIGRP